MQRDAVPGHTHSELDFDPSSGMLRVGGGQDVLRPRTSAVMAALLQATGRLVTKDELMRAAWPDAVVTEDSLTQCIKEIRKALGPAAGLVRTVPRRGYILLAGLPDGLAPSNGSATAAAGAPQFIGNRHLFFRSRRFLTGIGAIVLVMLALAGLRLATLSAPLPTPATVLVLPVERGGDVPAWLAEGLGDTLVDHLARFPSVRVTSRSSAEELARAHVGAVAAARAASTRYVVQGRIESAGDTLAVTVRLIESGKGAQLWSDEFRAPGAGWAELPRRLAERMTHALEIELDQAQLAMSAEGALTLPVPQQLTLQGWSGLHRGTREEVERARELFQRAVIADPRDGRAWIGLAHAHITSHVWRWAPQRQPSDLDAAEQAIAKARELSPHHIYVRGTLGVIHVIRGRFEEALPLLKAEVATYPSNSAALYWLGVALAWSGDYAGADAALRQTIELSPRDKFLSGFHRVRAGVLSQQGRHEEAVAEARKAIATANPHRLVHLTLAFTLQRGGRHREAQEAMADFLQRTPGYTLDKFMAEEFSRKPELLSMRAPVYEAMLAAGLPPR